MQRAEIERELKELTQKLGGGWRIEKGIMPVVVLTIDEARELDRRLDKESSDGRKRNGEGGRQES